MLVGDPGVGKKAIIDGLTQVAAVTPSRLLDTADRPSNKKDRKQWSEEMCGPSHKRLPTKLSSCGWKVTV